jgi:outer membrane protein assembly factor BamB
MIAVAACVLIGATIPANSVLFRHISQQNFDNNSLSILQPASATSSNIIITVNNNNSSLFQNESDTEEWLTYHHDFFRTGVDPYKLASPSISSLNKSWTSSTLDGDIYAEPLVARGMVFVATENNTIYSLKANTGEIIWHTSLGSPVPQSDLPCGNIDPTGITGTPVIDLRTQTIFAVAFLGETHRHELFALDLSTGKVRFETNVDPPGSDPKVHQQRGALALSFYNENSSSSLPNEGTVGEEGGREGMVVYVPYGGLFGDCGPYHGSVVGAPISYVSLGSSSNSNNKDVTSNNSGSENPAGSATTGSEETNQQLPLLSYQVPVKREAGIWAPSGPAIDQSGNILVSTGNGEPSDNFDYGDSVIKLSSDLGKVIDWFAPSNWAELDRSDTDLNAIGPSILSNNHYIVSDGSMENQSNNSTDTSEIFQIGKEGVGYLLNGYDLGGIDGQIFSAQVCDEGAFGGTAYAGPYLYVPCREGLVALYLQSAVGSNNNNNTAASGSNNNNDNPYSTYSVKWKGPSFNAGPPIVANGIVWSVDIENGQLYGFDQYTGETKFQEDLGKVVHFTTPSSSHGQLFVAASNNVLSFSVK